GRARGEARPRGGGRRGDGEARGPLPGRSPAGEGGDGRPGGGLPCLGGVLDAEGGSPERLDRRGARRARDADGDPPRGSGPDLHLLRQGSPGVAVVPRPKVRERKGGAAVPLDETDKLLMNLLQSSFPLDPEPFAAIARQAELPVEEVQS